MRITDRTAGEAGTERLTIVPDSVDDLWHLSFVIEPGDRAAGHTTRRIQRNDDQLRDTGGEREHLFLEISVEDVEFAKFANRLRVGGEIVDCSREDQLGFQHTINVEPHDELEIEKVWKADQLERLEEAVAATENPEVAIATVGEGEAHVHTVAQYGVDSHASIRGSSGKGEYADERTELFAELTSILSRLDVSAIILAGPGFTKQDALAYITDADPDVADLIRTVDTASVGDRGVHEVLKRGAVEEIQAETRIAKESALIDELTFRIGNDEPVAYGIESVAQAAEYGAVETLLVVDSRLRDERAGHGDWAVDPDTVIESVDQQGGEIVIFSHEFDPGQQLANLGGIAALLRYPIT